MENVEQQYGYVRFALSNILEVSAVSDKYETGKALSANNLMYEDLETVKVFSAENLLQAAKVFEKGGCKTELHCELLTARIPKRYLNF